MQCSATAGPTCMASFCRLVRLPGIRWVFDAVGTLSGEPRRRESARPLAVGVRLCRERRERRDGLRLRGILFRCYNVHKSLIALILPQECAKCTLLILMLSSAPQSDEDVSIQREKYLCH